jgi:hypothetical protein
LWLLRANERAKRTWNLHLSYLSAFLAVAASNQDSLILQALHRLRTLDKLLEWRVRLDKVLLRKRDAQFLAQFSDSGTLVLSASIGEQDEGNAVVVKVLKSRSSACNRG